MFSLLCLFYVKKKKASLQGTYCKFILYVLSSPPNLILISLDLFSLQRVMYLLLKIQLESYVSINGFVRDILIKVKISKKN
jgi:hypothetical protein